MVQAATSRRIRYQAVLTLLMALPVACSVPALPEHPAGVYQFAGENFSGPILSGTITIGSDGTYSAEIRTKDNITSSVGNWSLLGKLAGTNCASLRLENLNYFDEDLGQWSGNDRIVLARFCERTGGGGVVSIGELTFDRNER